MFAVWFGIANEVLRVTDSIFGRTVGKSKVNRWDLCQINRNDSPASGNPQEMVLRASPQGLDPGSSG